MEKTRSLEAKVKLLQVGLIALGLLNVFILLSAFGEGAKKKTFEEIDAERINIIGTNHKPVMVLSNNRLIPGPTINGKTYPKEFADGRENFSGIIFFNQYGDEVGGLLYNGFKKDSGYSALEHFSFDQWHQNQVVALQYIDNGRSKRAGLRVYDRPTNVTLDEMFDRFKKKNELPKNSPAYDSITKQINLANERGETGVERMFFGSQDEVAQIQLRDTQGKVRIKIYVDKLGQPRIEFFDEFGNPSKSF
jgi:hypothetical protein